MPAKSPADMSPAELTRAIARAEAESSAICDAFISAGRGHETPAETRKLSDPLSLRWLANARLCSDLRGEKARRLEWSGSLRRIRSAA